MGVPLRTGERYTEVGTKRRTFADAAELELTLTRRRGCEPATQKGYAYVWHRWLKPSLGKKKLKKLRPEHFEKLFAEMVEGDIASGTIGKTAMFARLALRHAERQDWVRFNAAKVAELPKRRERPKVWPQPDEVARFLAKTAEHDPLIHDYAFVLANTGMRPGEACALKTSDLIDNELTIERALDVCEGHARIKGTKTNKSRTLTVDDETARIIRSHEGPFVFGGHEPYRTDLMSKRFRRVAKRAKVCFTPRNLRHFHLTQLIAAGVDPKTVSERAGHANHHTTAQFYTGVVKRNDIAAAQVVANVMASDDDSESRPVGLAVSKSFSEPQGGRT